MQRPRAAGAGTSASAYLDNAGRDDVLSGGVRMIPVHTPKGTFRVWTKRVSNNPHQGAAAARGPGLYHEYFEAFDSYFPGAGIEYYYYDQLGSAYGDQPRTPHCGTCHALVEEVERRVALGLGPDNFYLFGQSWEAAGTGTTH